jgi:Uma2 family endonuclease
VERLVENYFETNPIGEVLGEVDCRISDDTIRRPDVSIFIGGRIQAIDMEAIPVPFAPDIAVEILSPSESAVNVRRKVREYLRAGSSEVWLVDHSNGEVLVHATAGIRVLQGDDNLESPLLPGFRADVAGLVK